MTSHLKVKSRSVLRAWLSYWRLKLFIYFAGIRVFFTDCFLKACTEVLLPGCFACHWHLFMESCTNLLVKIFGKHQYNVIITYVHFIWQCQHVLKSDKILWFESFSLSFLPLTPIPMNYLLNFLWLLHLPFFLASLSTWNLLNPKICVLHFFYVHSIVLFICLGHF